MSQFCSGILYGILDDDLMGFECVKVGCSKLGVKQVTLFFSPSVLADFPKLEFDFNSEIFIKFNSMN